MSAFEVGRICLKTRGRDRDRRCVVVDFIDRNFVLVTGPKSISGVRRRRVNVMHLIPLDEMIDIPNGASDEEVAEALG